VSQVGPASPCALQLQPTLPPSPATWGEAPTAAPPRICNHQYMTCLNVSYTGMNVCFLPPPPPPESCAWQGDLQLRDSVPVRSKQGSAHAGLGPGSGTGASPAQARALSHLRPGWTAPPHGGDTGQARPVKPLSSALPAEGYSIIIIIIIVGSVLSYPRLNPHYKLMYLISYYVMYYVVFFVLIQVTNTLFKCSRNCQNICWIC